MKHKLMMTNDDIWHWQHRFELGCIFGACLDPVCKTGRSPTPLASAWPCSTCSSCSSRSPPLLHADPHQQHGPAQAAQVARADLHNFSMQIPTITTAWPCSSSCRSPSPLQHDPAQVAYVDPHHHFSCLITLLNAPADPQHNCWQIPPPHCMPMLAHDGRQYPWQLLWQARSAMQSPSIPLVIYAIFQ